MLMMMEWNWVCCYFCLATRKLEVPVGAMPKSFGGEYYCLFGIAVLLIHKLGHLIRKPQKSICICVILAPTVALFQQDEREMCHRGFGFVTVL
ncbi:hypothetical protein CMV_004942 [Castanea mollissima]|uniref:Uncharacterized protein n=1 Tax=Castanea mollissima TaxID=60419 RepID=A0A8J4RKX0_9ROSI|nr:hypothetical protein CMV_004942 [Castanea mollissima]